jgi:hypothetical protein
MRLSGLHTLVLALLHLLPCSAAGVRDLVVFDEDDPLGLDYYDASIGGASCGSQFDLRASSRDKMPIHRTSAARGQVSGLLRWTSAADGDWVLRVYRPGFAAMDLRQHQLLSISLNAPKPLAANVLPIIELEDARGARQRRVIAETIDSDPATWQRVLVPIPPGLDLARVKHVTFRQNAADGARLELWIDDVRFVSTNRLVATAPPDIPKNLTHRAGDRSMTLHWDAIRDETLSGYHVYKASAPDGPYHRVSSKPLAIQSFADPRLASGRTNYYQVTALNEAGESAPSIPIAAVAKAFASDDEFLEYVQATAFDYFWHEANPENGLIRDRSQPWSAASIAALGFGLTALGIGIDHGWITREEGRERALRALHTLHDMPQGPGRAGTSGYHGWFYHFLDMETGLRFGASELSSIDSALLFAGVLYVAEYFEESREIRRLASTILDRVDWKWMLNGQTSLTMGWHPESGFLQARWRGYNEASILYLLGIGTGKRPLGREHWNAWTSTYEWRASHGFSFIHFAPLFGHQYSACWIDFRGIADDYTRSREITYFENSRRATLAQRAYCLANPGEHAGYGPNVWGLTACDGPGVEGTFSYIARGAPPPENDDGTIAPTAAGGSIAFTPEESLRALRHMYDTYREKIWCGYGFRDAFNPRHDWWGEDVIGIDQGPILIMIENHRTGKVWNVMRKSEVIQRGLNRAGFTEERN